MNSSEMVKKNRSPSNRKVLLTLVPFWSPLNPPLGITVLKSYLKQRGYEVATHDFNGEDELWQIIDKYFKIIREAVPQSRQGNFFMVGFDVLSNHLLAYLHKTHENRYHELIQILVRRNYFVEVDSGVTMLLDGVITEFYGTLRESLLRVLAKVKPDLFGVSVYSTSLGPALFAFRLVKEKYPHTETIMGGGVFADHLALDSPNFPVFLERTEDCIDTIIAGEGEILFQKYLGGQLEAGKRVYSLKDIHMENLDLKDSLIPDFSDLNLMGYSQMVTYASRSCPFQCGFCSETVQWGRYRQKKGEQVVREMADIQDKYGGKLFLLGDSLINPVIDDLSRSVLEKGLDVYWDGYLRADPAVGEPRKVDLWRQAGFYRARLGIESGSQRVLDLMDKKITVEQIKAALHSLANAGIKTTTYWVIGYPGETEADFADTLKLLGESRADIYEADWHPFYFFPRGQVRSHRWVEEFGIEPLYPPEFTDLLLIQTWVLKTNPRREEIYDRLNRFAGACREAGIPNPYSLDEIYQADKRWKELHPRCGPTILELHNFNYVK